MIKTPCLTQLLPSSAALWSHNHEGLDLVEIDRTSRTLEQWCAAYDQAAAAAGKPAGGRRFATQTMAFLSLGGDGLVNSLAAGRDIAIFNTGSPGSGKRFDWHSNLLVSFLR